MQASSGSTVARTVAPVEAGEAHRFQSTSAARKVVLVA
jgi:hypothetical protein